MTRNRPWLDREIEDCAVGLMKDNKGVSYYEAVMIAIQLQRNIMIARAFVLTPDDAYPTALEKCVRTVQDLQVSISDSLSGIDETLLLILEAIKKSREDFKGLE